MAQLIPDIFDPELRVDLKGIHVDGFLSFEEWQPLDNASFFATCERDEKGRCMAADGGGGNEGSSAVASEVVTEDGNNKVRVSIGGKLLGSISFKISNGMAHVKDQTVVVPESRGKGLVKHIYEEAFRQAKELGATSWQSHNNPVPQTKKIYQNLGEAAQFVPHIPDVVWKLMGETGERSGYYKVDLTKVKLPEPSSTSLATNVLLGRTEESWQPLDNASFFATCERDEKGRCTSGGGSQKPQKDFNPRTETVADRIVYSSALAFATMTGDEKWAVDDYTGDGFDPLNRAMRECPPKFDCLSIFDKDKVELLESAIKKSPPIDPPTQVYRGFKLPVAKAVQMVKELEDLQANGGEFQMPSFTSTTLDERIATSFGGSVGMKSGIVFRIAARSGLYVEGHTQNPGEQEIIQSPQARYRVAKITKNSGGSFVADLEEVL